MSGVTASYAMRREGRDVMSFVRNRNMARATRAKLGPVSHTVVVAILVLIVGLIYVNVGVRATSYDYELDKLNGDIATLAAEKDSLAVENTRLMAAAMSVDRNEVAMGMVDVGANGVVGE